MISRVMVDYLAVLEWVATTQNPLHSTSMMLEQWRYIVRLCTLVFLLA